ncbi:hypothetical protein C1H46_009695 [Malus baccata]|uniref:Uncharacterized protein n=1 Tax=Malus baccata TaxID=106549 RepID=A0A540N0Y4_MALBA|nr:hypothetical protein C1H46_009695 [Malus baccata]
MKFGGKKSRHPAVVVSQIEPFPFSLSLFQSEVQSSAGQLSEQIRQENWKEKQQKRTKCSSSGRKLKLDHHCSKAWIRKLKIWVLLCSGNYKDPERRNGVNNAAINAAAYKENLRIFRERVVFLVYFYFFCKRIAG